MKITRKIATTLCIAASPYIVKAAQCPRLEDGKQDAVQQYVQRRYEFPLDDHIMVTSVSVVDGTCYRQFSMQSEKLKKSFILYLSPDQRYVMTQVMDLTKDPQEEEHRKDAAVERALLSDASPTRGDSKAPVTIVEFSDFACPFCGRFKSLFDSLADSEKSKVRLVFKETPLPMHAWAAKAAELAVCAGQRGDPAFWEAHDFFFQNQKAFTQGNIQQQFMNFAGGTEDIDEQEVSACTERNAAEPVLARDKLLASKLGVHGTPTIFINGKQIRGVRSAGELTEVIDRAAAEQVPGQHSTANNGSKGAARIP